MILLTVEDSAIVRKIIRRAGEALEMEVMEAENGQQGYDTVAALGGKVDVILLDWNMPGMNGIELLKLLKADARYQHIPVMMVTTERHPAQIIEAVQAGAAHYMMKPFTMDELTKKILECVGRGGPNDFRQKLHS
jgi:two-component system chemotaxis response regulator CheY